MDGIITKQLLKYRSGEFDIESIHSLNLRCSDISDLGCIGECTVLERLNLHKNDICRLYALASLTNLQYLNLSANRITSLEGLQTLDSLRSLNLAGNLIGSFENLQILTGLENLEELRLQNKIENDLTNPVCLNENYKSMTLSMFPNLKMLDGEKLVGKGSEFYQLCDDIDKDLRVIGDLDGICRDGPVREKTMPTPWLPESYWQIKPCDMDDTILLQAEQQIHEFLDDCRRLSTTSDTILTQMEKQIHNQKT